LQNAGTTSLNSFKYSLLKDTVKKLEQGSLSAGSIFLIKNETSETLRKNTELGTENIKEILDHVPKHLRPLNDEQLGHYLAGLIDGDGHFSSQQQLIIVFNSKDVALAYFIKERLGHGSVRKVKDKNAYLLVISSKQGMIRVLNLINGKLRNISRFNQVIKNVLTNSKFINENWINTGGEDHQCFIINDTGDLDNHYIAGFSDADASFQIKIITKKNRNKPEIRLNYQVDQKYRDILALIKDKFGGNIGYRESQDTYYYGSTSFGSAKEIIKYFDTYHLQSSKHINYLKWRKAYIIIQSRGHLTDLGIKRITSLKNSLSSVNTEIQCEGMKKISKDKVLTRMKVLEN
jgi:hypothetical protein